MCVLIPCASVTAVGGTEFDSDETEETATSFSDILDIFATPEFSAAIFANMTALLTNERIAAGKAGLGFLNPLIYANPLKTGNNPGCNTPDFNATEGWDLINKFVAPSADTLSRVSSWLSGSNLTSVPVTPAGDWISVNITVAQANDLLAADFSTFQDQTINATVVRTLSSAIPSDLQGHIDWVHPTVKFIPSDWDPCRFVRQQDSNDQCQASYDLSIHQCRLPSQLELDSRVSPGTEYLVFNNDFANKRDLKTFLQLHRPDINPNTAFDLITLDGGFHRTPGTRDPDTQYTVGLATGVPVTYISTGTLPNDLLIEMLDQANFLLKLENPPQTILNTNSDTSIGLESVVPPAMGTYVFACWDGGTFFDNDEPEETGAFISGGGFSTVFGRPRYQDAAVSAYL
ncbi:Pro-kumamolisin, activation domain-containing protein [Mycena olivaceomarginata]|nr:Pro-kumamolisin, activation domain-containing protein [Mycena olivaceomarginata]